MRNENSKGERDYPIANGIASRSNSRDGTKDTISQKTHPRHTADARTRERTPPAPRPGESSDRESPDPSALTHAHPDDEGVELLAHDGILLADGGTDSRYVVPTGDGYLATYTVGDDRRLSIGTAGLGAWPRAHRVHAIDHEDGVSLRASTTDAETIASYRVLRRHRRARVCVGSAVLETLEVDAGDDVRVYDLEGDGILLVDAADDPRVVTDGGRECESDDTEQTAAHPRTRLATIDERTGTLLEWLGTDDGLTADERRIARRHLREIRARVESLSVVLRCPEVVVDRLDRDGECGERPDEHRDVTDDTTLPMGGHRGRHATTDLGPDSTAGERECRSRGDREERR